MRAELASLAAHLVRRRIAAHRQQRDNFVRLQRRIGAVVDSQTLRRAGHGYGHGDAAGAGFQIQVEGRLDLHRIQEADVATVDGITIAENLHLPAC